MRRKYRFVSPCPRCKSRKTGYFVYGTPANELALISSAMKKGELVRVRDGFRGLESTNCFCNKCNMEWYQKIETVRLHPAEIDEERKRRNATPERAKEIRWAKEKSKKELRKGRFKRMLNRIIA